MSRPEILKKSLDDYLKLIKSTKTHKLKVGMLTQRIKQLSKPKNAEYYEDLVGPGSYEPKDAFLSTKSKSPTVRIGKSLRFKNFEEPQVLKSTDSSLKGSSINSYSFGEIKTSRGYSFKRTGHNLKLVENPNFPGVGKYSPRNVLNNKSYSFNKSKREFNWKKTIRQLVHINEFQKKFVNNS